MTDHLGEILTNTKTSVKIINGLIERKKRIVGLLKDPEFAEKNINEIFSRSNRSWGEWSGLSDDNSKDYQKICISLINDNLIDSHLNLPMVKDFVISHIDTLKNPLEILNKIAKHSEGEKLDDNDVNKLYELNQKNLLLDCHTLNILNNDYDLVPTDLLGNIFESVGDWAKKEKEAPVSFDIKDMQNYMMLRRQYTDSSAEAQSDLLKESASNNILYSAAIKDFNAYLREKPKSKIEEIIKEDQSWPDNDFSEGDFSNVNFSGLDLSNFNFDDCKLDKSTFVECKLNETSFEDCSLVGAEFYHNDMIKTDFVGADLEGALFGSISKEQAYDDENYGFVNMINEKKHEENANIMSEVDFSYASLKGTIFSSNKISNDLSFNNTKNIEEAIFDNVLDMEGKQIINNDDRKKYNLPLSGDDYLPEDKEAVYQAQQSAIKAIRAIGIGSVAFSMTPSFVAGSVLAPTLAYSSTYFDTYLVNWLREDSKEPIPGKLGMELARLGQISRLIDSEIKKDITAPEVVQQVFKTSFLLALSSSSYFSMPANLLVATYTAYDINEARKKASLEVSKVYDRIQSQIGDIWNAKSIHEIGKEINKGEKVTKKNYEDFKKNKQNLRESIKKNLTTICIGAAVFLAIVGISIVTGGIAPASIITIAAAVGGAVALSAYMGYEPSKKILSNCSDFGAGVYNKLKKSTKTNINTQQDVDKNIESLISDNNPQDKETLSTTVNELKTTLQSHGVNKEVAVKIIEAELTYDKAGADEGIKHLHATQEIELLDLLTKIVKSGDENQQINVTSEITTTETMEYKGNNKKINRLGDALKNLGVEHIDEIKSQEGQKLSTLSKKEYKKELNNIKEIIKLVKKCDPKQAQANESSKNSGLSRS